MHEIIAQIQQDLYCPVCGKNYEIGEIRLRGLLDQTLIIQTICDSGHMTLFVTIFRNKTEEKKSLTANDVLDLKNALGDFDGDFQKIWNN